MSEEEKKKSFDVIRKINNKIFNVRLTFLEMEQLETWLANIVVEDDKNAKAILERINIALDESQNTGESV